MRLPPRQARPAPLLRGFTLIELIVVILILGILAALAVVGYGVLTDRAHASAAQSNLRQLSTAVIASATLNDAPVLDRPLVRDAIAEGLNVDVQEGVRAAGEVYLGLASQSPKAGDYAIGFDAGDGSAQNDGGSLAVLVTTSQSGSSYARTISWRGNGADRAGQVPDGTTPADVIANPDLIDNPNAGPGGGGDSGPTTPPTGNGQLGATFQVGSYDSPEDGGRFEYASFSVLGWPAGAVDGDHGGLAMTCDVSVPLPNADVQAPTWFDGAEWGSLNPVDDVNRLYTCTLDAKDVDGNVVGSITLSGTPGGEPVVVDNRLPVPAVNVNAAPQGDGIRVAWDALPAVTSWYAEATLDGTYAGGCSAPQGETTCDVPGLAAGAQYEVTVEGQLDSVRYQSHVTKSAGSPITLKSPWESLDVAQARAVATDGTRTIVATQAGTAKVFTRSGDNWDIATLTLAHPGHYTGASVDIAGTTAIVGSPDSNDGSVEIFELKSGTWVSQVELRGSITCFGEATYGTLGGSVAIHGDSAFVQCPGFDAAGYDRSTVKVYTRTGSTWALTQTLTGGVGFGTSLDVDATAAVIGDTTAGTAHVYTRSGSTWVLQQSVRSDEQYTGDGFGYAVDLSGSTLVVGAPGPQTMGRWDITGEGAAHVFERSGSAWTQTRTLTSNATSMHGQPGFGESVAIADQSILVGVADAPAGDVHYVGGVRKYSRTDAADNFGVALAVPNVAHGSRWGSQISAAGDMAVISGYGEVNSTAVFAPQVLTLR